MQRTIFSKIMPYFFLGIALVLLVVGVVLLSYLLIIGAVVGLVLFIIASLKDKLFNKHKTPPKKRLGRTIDHNDL